MNSIFLFYFIGRIVTQPITSATDPIWIRSIILCSPQQFQEFTFCVERPMTVNDFDVLNLCLFPVMQFLLYHCTEVFARVEYRERTIHLSNEIARTQQYLTDFCQAFHYLQEITHIFYMSIACLLLYDIPE